MYSMHWKKQKNENKRNNLHQIKNLKHEENYQQNNHKLRLRNIIKKKRDRLTFMIWWKYRKYNIQKKRWKYGGNKMKSKCDENVIKWWNL